MKIFLSWSGDRSHAVATLLKTWLKLVIQSLDPWLSSQNVENGSIWYNEITTQLQEMNTGILCLTQENKNKPWILFEAGALAKGLSTSRVCTLLIDLEPKDVEPPLSQFNHTKVTREGLRKLIGDLNTRLGDKALEDSILAEAFEAHWPRFEKQYQIILAANNSETNPKTRSTDDLVTEILENTREILSMAKQTQGARQQAIIAKEDRIRLDSLHMDHGRINEQISHHRRLLEQVSKAVPNKDSTEHLKRIEQISMELSMLEQERKKLSHEIAIAQKLSREE